MFQSLFVFLFLFAGVDSMPINININTNTNNNPLKDTSKVILIDYEPINNLELYNEVGPIFFQVKPVDLLNYVEDNFNNYNDDLVFNFDAYTDNYLSAYRDEYIQSFLDEYYDDLILVSKNTLEQPSTNHSCEVCKVIVGVIEREIHMGNNTVHEIIDMVENICHVIGGPSAMECEFIVNNINKIISYVENGFNSSKICQFMDSCPTCHNDIHEIKKSVDDSNSTCKLCHILVDVISKELNLGNKTINDIINIVDDICKIVGGPDGVECKFIVDSIKEIINYLNQGFSNLKICELLHLCNSSNFVSFSIENKSSKVGEL